MMKASLSPCSPLSTSLPLYLFFSGHLYSPFATRLVTFDGKRVLAFSLSLPIAFSLSLSLSLAFFPLATSDKWILGQAQEQSTNNRKIVCTMLITFIWLLLLLHFSFYRRGRETLQVKYMPLQSRPASECVYTFVTCVPLNRHTKVRPNHLRACYTCCQ